MGDLNGGLVRRIQIRRLSGIAVRRRPGGGMPGYPRSTARNSVGMNILATGSGKVVTSIITIVCVPFYIKLLGIAAYGLTGFYSTVVLMLSVLDFGLGLTLNRELAIASGTNTRQFRARSLVRTMETVYWAVAALVGMAWTLSAHWLATHWLMVDLHNRDETARAVFIMGLVFVLQWPQSLYMNGLLGLQRQVDAAWITVFSAALRGIGGILCLAYFSPTATTFFISQAIAAAAATVAVRCRLWRALPGNGRGVFEWAELKRVQRFSIGVTGISFLTLVLHNVDKVLLSRLLPLRLLGCYTLAVTIGSSLFVVASSFQASLYPRFAELFAAKQHNGVARVYHAGCQAVTACVVPVGFTIVVFSEACIRMWTRNPALAAEASPVVRLYTLGCLLNCFMYVPHSLGVASGWTAFALYQNSIAVAFLIPVSLLAATHFGSIGTSVAWIGLNVGYIAVAIPLLHAKLLPGETKAWYIRDILYPASAASLPVLFGRLIMSWSRLTVNAEALVACVVGIAVLLSIISSSSLRAIIARHVTRNRGALTPHSPCAAATTPQLNASKEL